MGWLSESLNSSIGKKFVMAITGVALILFLIIHLAGNLTLYGGEEAFNSYVSTLDVVKPVIRVIEVILLAVFVGHILNGIRLTIQNLGARPQKYAVNGSKTNTTIYSRTMIITGSIVFIFLVMHLSTIWAAFNLSGSEVEHEYYKIVVDWFQNPVYALAYVISVLLLGFHLNHGFQSAFQTFGWNHNKYFPFIKKLGTVYSLIMAIGFASIPIYFLFFYGGN
ncbi:MAG: succinate dehydrogenase [Ignavibacteria bacterium]|nr:MAG: succinate dehydrogenase [Ignavibacteria bacterium]